MLGDAQVANNHALGPAGASNAAPTLEAIADQIVSYGTASIEIPLTVGDADSALASLTLSGEAADPAFLPAKDIAFSGSGASRTATITLSPGMTGTTAITSRLATA